MVTKYFSQVCCSIASGPITHWWSHVTHYVRCLCAKRMTSFCFAWHHTPHKSNYWLCRHSNLWRITSPMQFELVPSLIRILLWPIKEFYKVLKALVGLDPSQDWSPRGTGSLTGLEPSWDWSPHVTGDLTGLEPSQDWWSHGTGVLTGLEPSWDWSRHLWNVLFFYSEHKEWVS